MTVLRWVISIAIFVALLLLSLKNAQPVKIWLYGWSSSEVPLIFILLVAFAAGVIAGLLVGAVRTARLKRQLNRLRRDHTKLFASNAIPPAES